MRIVIAPDSFKEALAAREACSAIARGVRRVLADAEIDEILLADGGEGTVDALVAATGGSLRRATVTGPLGEPVEASWGVLGDETRTAVIEMAAASGLALVPPGRRDPTRTTTFGTGELIRAALDAGTTRVVIGIGGSATNDGGVGAAQAVGVRFLDACGQVLLPPVAGGDLDRIESVDTSGRDGRVAGVEMRVACDVDNPLCGPRGAAAVYGPQKGATPEQVERLDRNLAHLADVIERDLGRDIRVIPGAGAAGGLGAGLLAFFDARIEAGIEVVLRAVDFGRRIVGADLILTGEGRLDRQSMMGKVIAGVGRAGRDANIPVVALVGAVGEGAEEALQLLDSFHDITPPGTPLPEALARTAEHLEAAAASCFRVWADRQR